MHCRACGEELESDDLFCTYCGKPVKPVSSKADKRADKEVASEVDEGVESKTESEETPETEEERPEATPSSKEATPDDPQPKEKRWVWIVAAAVLAAVVLGAAAYLAIADPLNWFGEGDSPAAVSGEVAATVNGVEILESDVTAVIDTFRIDRSTDTPLDDEAWAQMLVQAGYTPESLREMVIRQQFGIYILILQRAETYGIEPDAATVEQNISDAKASAEAEGGEWGTYLVNMGFKDEAAFRRVLEAQTVVQALLEADIPDATPSAAEIETYVSENAAQYAGKRLAAIYLPLTGEEPLETVQATADEALAKIKGGTPFADVAAEYSKDAYTAEIGGDLGWGSEAYLPTELQTAVDALAVDEVSDVLVVQGDSTNAVFIIKVTDEFAIPAGSELAPVDFASVPASLVEDLSQTFRETKISEAQNAYFDSLVMSEEIVINPMPAGLSYDVDMSLAESTGSDTGSEVTPAPTATPVDPEAAESAMAAIAANDGTLQINDIVEGTGAAAKAGDVLSVDYTGYLADGSVFDSSVGSTPLAFELGAGSLIQGWEQGLVGMKVGGKRQLVIPPSLAYGAAGMGSVPGDATLVFDLELVAITEK